MRQCHIPENLSSERALCKPQTLRTPTYTITTDTPLSCYAFL